MGVTAKKAADFSEWYNQVVLHAGLADYSAVKGFMVIRPLGYAVWEKIQSYLDARFKELGHQNAYFPALVPESFLKKESQHLAGFSPEVFWIQGDEKTEERLALRPTSETIIYDSYSKWVRSWRDLPLLINCWNSVFRSEIKMTKLFLRTREFLWQEGHTAHATKEEADEEVLRMLRVYVEFVESQLAIPVLHGYKTDAEKFAGALYTTSMESLMPDGKMTQMGTSHQLGQNFSRAFHITFLDKQKEQQFAWQTSWGVSTRLIGAMVMTHSDDKGLVLPPLVAPLHVVIVPIVFDDSKEKVLKAAKELQKKLNDFTIRLDDRDGYSAGWKFNEWELKGVPIRLELGPKDLQKKQVVMVSRDNGAKKAIKWSALSKAIRKELDDMQKRLFNKAKKFLEGNIVKCKSWGEFQQAIESKKIAFAFHCGDASCEKEIKEKTTATARCIPFDQPKTGGLCIHCGNSAKRMAYFSKSY